MMSEFGNEMSRILPGWFLSIEALRLLNTMILLPGWEVYGVHMVLTGRCMVCLWS